MSLIEENTADAYVTALSDIFEDLEIGEEAVEENDDLLHPLPSFKMFSDNHNHSEGISSSTPKRLQQRVFKKRFLQMDEAECQTTPQLNKTPPEVARLVALKGPEFESPLPKLPPVVLTPWSKMLRDAIQAKEAKTKKVIPPVKQRMSLRL